MPELDIKEPFHAESEVLSVMIFPHDQEFRDDLRVTA
jgi:hypothetical protein